MDKTEQWVNLHGRAEATVEVLSIQRAELVESGWGGVTANPEES